MGGAGVPDRAAQKLTMRATLAHALRNDFERTATLSELAIAAHMSIDEVVTELGEVFDGGLLGIEAVDGELFILPHPSGRLGTEDETPRNLWEDLRERRTLEEAAGLYRLYRSLERAGWHVIVNPGRWNSAVVASGVRCDLGVVAGGVLVPLVSNHTEESISETGGVIQSLYRAGVQAVAVVCPQHRLDSYVTAARKWFLSQVAERGIVVLVLEAPRLQPVIVRHSDKAVDAVSVGEHTIEGISW
jgi:hypothetical protein